MSGSMMSLALRWRGLSLSERVIFASLCDRANADHQCWPKVETLALDHEMSRRAVLAALDQLGKLGLIRSEKRHKLSSVYHIVMSKFHNGNKSGNGQHPPDPVEPIYAPPSEPQVDPDAWRAEFAPQPCGAEFAPEPEVQNSTVWGAKNDDFGVQNLHTESPNRIPQGIPASGVSPPRAQAPAPAHTRRGDLTIDEKWQPSERDRQHARSLGYSDPDIDRIIGTFRDWHLASGRMVLDWSARWRYWLADEARHRARRHVPDPTEPPAFNASRLTGPFAVAYRSWHAARKAEPSGNAPSYLRLPTEAEAIAMDAERDALARLAATRERAS